MPFVCSICGEESTRICVRCTKDTCSNHLCEKCRRCSDCCECEVLLDEGLPHAVRPAVHAAPPEPEPDAGPDSPPEPPLPPLPDPIPFPGDSEPELP
jgi:hypothetical protein